MRSQKPLVEVLHCCFEYCEVKAAIQNFCNWSYRMSIGLNSFHLFIIEKLKIWEKKARFSFANKSFWSELKIDLNILYINK